MICFHTVKQFCLLIKIVFIKFLQILGFTGHISVNKHFKTLKCFYHAMIIFKIRHRNLGF